jgi:hypothetical protein
MIEKDDSLLVLKEKELFEFKEEHKFGTEISRSIATTIQWKVAQQQPIKQSVNSEGGVEGGQTRQRHQDVQQYGC